MKPSIKSIDDDEKQALKTVLKRIEKDDYFNWILTKSYTNTSKGKIVSLDLSWLGIRYLPTRFLEGLNYIRELRFDNNPDCNFEQSCFEGAPRFIGLKLRYCNLKEIPYQAFSTKTHLQNLQLTHNPIRQISPEEFSELVSLQMLDLSDCKIEKLQPNTFECIPTLKSLQLENNGLTELKDYTFSSLVNLKNLNVQNNRIHTLGKEAFADLGNLENLTLSKNRLKLLPKGVFRGLDKLQSLSLYNNKLEAIGSNFAFLKGLVNLSLDSNFITEIPSDAFTHNNRLITIDLQHNQIRTIHEDSFSDLDSLEFLNLQNNPIDIESALKLPNSARFDYMSLIADIDSETLHYYITSYPQNTSFINQAIYSGKLLEKTRAFLRVIGFDHR